MGKVSVMNPGEDEQVVDTDSIEQAETEVEAGVEDSGEQSTESADGEESGEDGIVVSIGDEEPEEQQSAPNWVKELRKNHKESQRKIKELEEQLAASKNPADDRLPEKPTLEGCNYDEEEYETRYSAWIAKKSSVEQKQRMIEEEQRKQQEAWQNKLASYSKAKEELKVADYDDAEETVQTMMNQVQQGIILQGADNPALVILALGRNPNKAKELASITDPVQFAVSIGKLEKGITMKPRKSAPAEKTVKGSGSFAGTTGGELDRLRDEAAKTGDLTKVIQYKKMQKQKQA